MPLWKYISKRYTHGQTAKSDDDPAYPRCLSDGNASAQLYNFYYGHKSAQQHIGDSFDSKRQKCDVSLYYNNYDKAYSVYVDSTEELSLHIDDGINFLSDLMQTTKWLQNRMQGTATNKSTTNAEFFKLFEAMNEMKKAIRLLLHDSDLHVHIDANRCKWCSNAALIACSRCGIVRYCSLHCQQRDTTDHNMHACAQKGIIISQGNRRYGHMCLITDNHDEDVNNCRILKNATLHLMDVTNYRTKVSDG